MDVRNLADATTTHQTSKAPVFVADAQSRVPVTRIASETGTDRTWGYPMEVRLKLNEKEEMP